MSFVDVAGIDEVSAGAMKPFAVAGHDLLIVNHGGSYYAIPRRCTHLGGDLSKGTLDGTTVTCPRHHTRFDVTTGHCLSGPQIGPLKLSTKDTTSYEVRIEGQRIQVNL
jgi:3-phenylpropionate/trans-cinnamate dioxygenase ferredoxin subunit